jgi:hypothetical protein
MNCSFFSQLFIFLSVFSITTQCIGGSSIAQEQHTITLNVLHTPFKTPIKGSVNFQSNDNKQCVAVNYLDSEDNPWLKQKRFYNEDHRQPEKAVFKLYDGLISQTQLTLHYHYTFSGKKESIRVNNNQSQQYLNFQFEYDSADHLTSFSEWKGYPLIGKESCCKAITQTWNLEGKRHQVKVFLGNPLSTEPHQFAQFASKFTPNGEVIYGKWQDYNQDQEPVKMLSIQRNNSDKKITSMSWENQQRELLAYEEYSYQAIGKIAKEKIILSKDTQPYFIQYHYNSENHLSKITIFDKDSECLGFIDLQSNSEGQGQDFSYNLSSAIEHPDLIKHVFTKLIYPRIGIPNFEEEVMRLKKQ